VKTKLPIFFFIFHFQLLICHCFAQSPNWQWAKSAGGGNDDHGQSISTDANGNVYATGSFRSSSITFGSITLTNAGQYDIYVVKYDALGNVLWAKSAGGSDWDEAQSISSDASGNSYVTGNFSSSSIAFGTITLTKAGSSSSQDIFVVKYDALGNVLWAKRAGGTDSEKGYGIATDLNGNVFVTGYFQSTSVVFGATTLVNTAGASFDIFVAKYDPSGNVLWAKSAGGTNWDYGQNVSDDAFGNVFVTGYFRSSSITFGGTTLTNASTGSDDIFVVKYDASGNVLWAKSGMGNNQDNVYGISTDKSGNVFVTGIFSYIIFGTTILNSTGIGDVFVVKYDALGNVLWAKRAGGGVTSYSWGYDISNDVGGNVYVTGYFNGSSITFGTTILTNVSSNTYDMFVVKYNTSGNVLWAKSAGGTSDDYGQSIATDTNGNVYVAGYFKSPSITFGTTILTNASSTSYNDIFVAKLDGSGVTGTHEFVNYNFETSIYPNPSNGIFTFQSSEKKSRIEIINILGEVVYSENINSEKGEINLSDKNKGMYFYKLVSENKSLATGKLIIQ